jgi:transposase
MKGLITMSATELSRLEVLQRIEERRLSQREGATILGLTERQVRRLVQRFRHNGPGGLVSRKRGQRGHHRFPDAFRDQVVAIVREHYHDFGPTLAREKLLERHGLAIGRETLRSFMMQAGLWLSRSARRKAVQQPRARRTCFGELIQIDGCEHAWFEDRGPTCTLLTYVDDATSRLQLIRFAEGESTFEYMEATKTYLTRYGKPVAFYSDKHTVFRVNKAGALQGTGMTQFGRALHELDVEIMCANTPAAKGRVERAHSTLQDRLVKELRLQRISTLREANAFAAAFIDDYNARFAKPAYLPHDVHRPLLAQESLDDTFTWQEQRSVSQALTLQYDKVMYLLEPTSENHALSGKRVTVIDYPDNRIRIFFEGRELQYRQFDKLTQTHQGEIVLNKRLGSMLSFIQQRQQQLPREKRSVKCPTRRYPAPAANR